jgi:hypothetical protein
MAEAMPLRPTRKVKPLWEAGEENEMEHGQTFVFILTLMIFALVLGLVKRRKITEHFAVLWVSISFGLLVASSIGFPYLFQIAAFLGIPYPPSALFLLVIFGLTMLVIQLFAWVSKLNDRSRALTQQVAILSEQLERLMDRAQRGNAR